MNFTSSQCLMHFYTISKNWKRKRWKRFTHGKDGKDSHTEKMDFTDFMEPWSFEFIQFHTFFVFVLDNCFLQISQRHEASVEFNFHLEHYRNFFKKGPLWKGMRKTINSWISLPKLLLNGDTKCITPFPFQRTFHHTRKRWILRILWSHGASSSYIFIHFLFSF